MITAHAFSSIQPSTAKRRMMRRYEARLPRSELQWERLPPAYFTGILQQQGDPVWARRATVGVHSEAG